MSKIWTRKELEECYGHILTVEDDGTTACAECGGEWVKGYPFDAYTFEPCPSSHWENDNMELETLKSDWLHFTNLLDGMDFYESIDMRQDRDIVANDIVRIQIAKELEDE